MSLTATAPDAPVAAPADARRVGPVAAVALLAIVMAVSVVVVDTGGHLGTDSGAKVATLEAMTANGRWVPDTGYWAAEADPDGAVHPLWHTVRRENGWINVTTLPMLYAASPLYQLGGLRLALLVPALGTVVAALAAAALARRLGDESAAWRAFWLVGLASPLTVYALDFWEHSWGVALAGWAGVLLWDAAHDFGWRRPLAAGLLFGLAATMRTETLVYAAVAIAAVGLAYLVRRRLVAGVITGSVFSVGLGIVLVAYDRIEQSIFGGQSLRAGRAGSTAGQALDDVSTRLGEGLLTTFGVSPTRPWSTPIVFGVMVAALVVVALVKTASAPPGDDDGEVIGRAAMVMAPLLVVLPLLSGLGFVPGLVPTTPFAVAGVWGAVAMPRLRPFIAPVLVALPLVWAAQYTGGAGPQWAGRYVLITGFVLMVAGVVATNGLPRPTRTWLTAVAGVITVLGVLWVGERTRAFADLGDQLVAQDAELIVSEEPFLLREFGSLSVSQPWLTVYPADELVVALGVADRFDIDEVLVLQTGRRPIEVAGWTEVGERALTLFDPGDITLVELARNPG